MASSGDDDDADDAASDGGDDGGSSDGTVAAAILASATVLGAAVWGVRTRRAGSSAPITLDPAAAKAARASEDLELGTASGPEDNNAQWRAPARGPPQPPTAVAVAGATAAAALRKPKPAKLAGGGTSLVPPAMALHAGSTPAHRRSRSFHAWEEAAAAAPNRASDGDMELVPVVPFAVAVAAVARSQQEGSQGIDRQLSLQFEVERIKLEGRHEAQRLERALAQDRARQVERQQEQVRARLAERRAARAAFKARHAEAEAAGKLVDII